MFIHARGVSSVFVDASMSRTITTETRMMVQGADRGVEGSGLEEDPERLNKIGPNKRTVYRMDIDLVKCAWS